MFYFSTALYRVSLTPTAIQRASVRLDTRVVSARCVPAVTLEILFVTSLACRVSKYFQWIEVNCSVISAEDSLEEEGNLQQEGYKNILAFSWNIPRPAMTLLEDVPTVGTVRWSSGRETSWVEACVVSCPCQMKHLSLSSLSPSIDDMASDEPESSFIVRRTSDPSGLYFFNSRKSMAISGFLRILMGECTAAGCGFQIAQESFQHLASIIYNSTEFRHTS